MVPFVIGQPVMKPKKRWSDRSGTSALHHFPCLRKNVVRFLSLSNKITHSNPSRLMASGGTSFSKVWLSSGNVPYLSNNFCASPDATQHSYCIARKFPYQWSLDISARFLSNSDNAGAPNTATYTRRNDMKRSCGLWRLGDGKSVMKREDVIAVGRVRRE